MKRRNFLDYSHFNVVLLNVCGLLPFKSGYNLFNLILGITNVLASIFIFGPGLYTLFFRWNSITAAERLTILSEENVHIICAIKACILIPKRKKLFRLTESCAKLWKYVETEEDSKIVSGYAKRGLYLSYGFAANCFLGISFCLVTPFFENFVLDANGTVVTSKALPYSAGLFHDDVHTFYLWYALQVPTSCDSLLAIVAIDTGLSFYILHACAHMRLCQKFFQRISDDITRGNDLEIDDAECIVRREHFFRHVIKSVSYHKQVLQYSNDLEEIFASIILVQTMQGILAICGYSFAALLGEEKERPRGAACALAVTLQLLLLCWPPDTLQDESMRVAHAAYDLPWYDWTAKEGRLVAMIITKSQRPVTLTAKKFTVVSLQTFTFVLKTAFSVITLLRKVL